MMQDVRHVILPKIPEEWRSVSVYGDPWEVELDIYSDRYRYRSAMFGRIRTEWSYGRPPTGAHAARKKWVSTYYPVHEELNDPEDGAVVIYGPKGSGAGCGEPSFSIWMVPGTGHEAR
jgi:hypothetical protein